MLFNSYIFIFAFLPVTVFFFYIFNLFSRNYAIKWLIIASLLFYGYFNLYFVLLIIFSILFNYLISNIILTSKDQVQKKYLLIFGVVCNLFLLGYFKYKNFFLSNFQLIFDYEFNITVIILPLAISFFTFQQIAYLFDCREKQFKKYNFFDYSIFILFFPQLIAGPIVKHDQLIPQLRNNKNFVSNIYFGIIIFIIGLSKKVIIGDSLGHYADQAFYTSSIQGEINLIDAWIGIMSFTFQIYFDFSGYSDMAIGLARMFGINLPLNFNSPYKATSIIDFWRRWHITLSNFLRDYLYIKLGGNRDGNFNRYRNLFLTMLLGGLWHGSSWNFVIWGGLHGLLLIINHTFNKFFKINNFIINKLSLILTFFCVSICWVFFRAKNLEEAKDYIDSLFSIQNITIPSSLYNSLELNYMTYDLKIFISQYNEMIIDSKVLFFLSLASIICFLFPNINNLENKIISMHNSKQSLIFLSLFILSIMFICSLILMFDSRKFIYFQF